MSHFSTWNADYLYESITISGCVVDESGNKVANSAIRMEGFSYNGSANAITDASGNFSVLAMNGGISLINATASGKASNTLKLGPLVVNTTVENCLILGEVPLTVRLTWGENPEDLDTHVFGPNNYHISFMNQGSLNSTPFAQLDVDDVTSYGPEVFTALSFPQAGTYLYAVNLYAGSSTIFNSPARVELNLNGQITVFNPPASGDTTKVWWNVFKIIVDESGNIQIETVNTWSDTPVELSAARLATKIPPKK